jgi:hypothetical protein
MTVKIYKLGFQPHWKHVLNKYQYLLYQTKKTPLPIFIKERYAKEFLKLC